MTIKCYKLLSNWLSWVVLILMIGTSPIIQAATDCDAVTEISKGECESLLELYNSTDGANWTDNSGWNVTNTPCSWFGVTCENGGVDYISLSDNQLSGSIPDFSALPNLTSLYLSSNQLCKDKNTNYGKWQSTVNQYPDCPTSEPQTYTLSTSSDPENGGSVSRSPAKDSYNHNETVILTAIANSGYDFVRWQDDATGNNSTTSVTMDSDKTITVIFKANTHRLLISYDPENGGSVSRSPAKDLYIHNETVNLTASPNQCYKFTGWGDACSGSSSCELIMDRDKSVIANFKIKSFKLNISSDNGIVKRQPNKTLYDCGETVELIATPNKGYEFTAWSGDVNSTNKSITVNMDTDLNLKAMFIVTAELKVTPSGPLTLSFGESIELTASGGQPPYNWTITDGKLTSKEGTRTTYIAPKIAGDNTITLTDDRGEKVEVKVKVIGELVCSPTVVTVILGDPNPVTFKAAGGAEPYKWSADNGLVNPIEGPETNYQPPAQTGDYHVTCKDNKDNSIKSLVRVVPSVAITPAQIDLTKGETVTLEVAW